MPTIAVSLVQVFVGFWNVRNLEISAVPFKGLSGEVDTQVAQLCSLGQWAGVIEIRLGLALAQTCIDPLLVTIDVSIWL